MADMLLVFSDVSITDMFEFISIFSSVFDHSYSTSNKVAILNSGTCVELGVDWSIWEVIITWSIFWSTLVLINILAFITMYTSLSTYLIANLISHNNVMQTFITCTWSNPVSQSWSVCHGLHQWILHISAENIPWWTCSFHYCCSAYFEKLSI